MKTIEFFLSFLFKVIGGTIVVLGAILALLGDFGIAAQRGAVAALAIGALVFFKECYSMLFSRKTTNNGDEEE